MLLHLCAIYFFLSCRNFLCESMTSTTVPYARFLYHIFPFILHCVPSTSISICLRPLFYFRCTYLGISLLSFFWIFPHSISIYSLTTFSLSVNALNSTLIDVIFFYHSMATLSFLSFCCTLVQSISISSTTSLSNFLFLCRNVVEITKSTFPPITAKS